MVKYSLFPIIILALLLAGPQAEGQSKIAYVDIATVMAELPEAQDAQRMLDNLVDNWQKELDALEKEWQTKFEDYDKRKLILTDQGRANAERELQALDAQIMQFRESKFGQDGELFIKEEELMRPIQNMVFEQVEFLAKEKGYDYVIDKSSGASLLYANDKLDLTQELITRIETLLPARETPEGTGFDRSPSGTPPSSGGQDTRTVPPPPRSDPGGK